MTEHTAELSDEEQFASLRESRTSEPEPAKPASNEADRQEPVTPEPAPAPEDPFAGWPEPAKAKYLEQEALAKKLAIERDAAVGRLAPIQRKLSDLERSSVAPKVTPAPARPAPPRKRDSYFDSQEWKAWAEEYPEDAKRQRAAIEAEREAMREEMRNYAKEEAAKASGAVRDELGRFVSPHIERIEQRERAEAVAKLTTAHPNWSSHFRLVPVDDGNGNVDYSPESSPQFDAWFDSLHRRDQDSVRAALWSDDPEDCAWVVSRFEGETGSTEPPADPAENAAIAKKAEARRKNLETSTQPANTPTPTPVRVNPEDLSDEDRFALIRSKKR